MDGGSEDHPGTDANEVDLNLGAEGSQRSRYSVYRIWLAKLSRWMGWKVECEVLRIPSTRNWAIIGTVLSLALCGVTLTMITNRAREAANQRAR